MKNIVILLMILMSSQVFSHPVAYQGAYSFMSINSKHMSDNILVYSPKYWFGYGLKHTQHNDKFNSNEDKKFTNLHLGFLLKRWNEFKSQGNIYLFGGPGNLEYKNKNYYFTRYGFQADWESRYLYTLFKYTSAQSTVLSDEMYKVAFGFAPLVREYNELNGWVIFEVSHHPQSTGSETSITPILRLYYENILWEIGSSLDGDWNLNFMARF